jgi:hypothetical protein
VRLRSRTLERIDMAKKQPSNDVSIGKFDILATYTYAGALLDGRDDDEANQRGIVAAIMGAHARLGIRKDHKEEFQSQKEAAEKKKKTTITAESFDKQVAHKMGEFFEDVFVPRRLPTTGFDPRAGQEHLIVSPVVATRQRWNYGLRAVQMPSMIVSVEACNHRGGSPRGARPPVGFPGTHRDGYAAGTTRRFGSLSGRPSHESRGDDEDDPPLPPRHPPAVAHTADTWS